MRTGGSAQIPCFVEMMGRVLEPEMIEAIEAGSIIEQSPSAM
jgi:hypothetical protein